jgi:hypothetical protein
MSCPFLKKRRNDVREAPGLQGRSVGLGDMPIIIRPDGEPEQFLSLSKPPAAQFVHSKGGQGDGSGPAALGLFLPDGAGVGLLGRRDNGELGAVQVDRLTDFQRRFRRGAGCRTSPVLAE